MLTRWRPPRLLVFLVGLPATTLSWSTIALGAQAGVQAPDPGVAGISKPRAATEVISIEHFGAGPRVRAVHVDRR